MKKETEKFLKKVIFRYVDKEQYYVLLFGSRAGKTAKPASDYDVGIYGKAKVPWGVLAKVHGEFEESALPVKVDIVDFASVSQEFKDLALEEIKVWNRPKRFKRDLPLI